MLRFPTLADKAGFVYSNLEGAEGVASIRCCWRNGTDSDDEVACMERRARLTYVRRKAPVQFCITITGMLSVNK